MKVQELLTNLKNRNFDMEKELQVKTYLPIKEKQMIAQLIINECTEEVDGVIKLDSMQQYLSYVKYMIKMHTCLEYTDEDYDVLCSTEYEDQTILNKIMFYFGVDANECSRILNLMLDDYMRENSIECTVGRFLNGLNNTISSLAMAVLGDFDINSIVPKDLDTTRLNEFLKTYVK